MLQRAKRPSRLVQSVARWAITLGSAGTIVGVSAMYSVLLGKQLASNRHGMLMLSAILLALAFVLAPVVRRAFSQPGTSTQRSAASPKTLLEELREAPTGESAGEPSTAALELAAPADAPGAPGAVPASLLTARLVTGAYLVFAATLLVILWALQTT